MAARARKRQNRARRGFRVERQLKSIVLCRPGSDLLSQVLRHSTIGAEEFNGRVRDGIGFRLLATATRPAKDNRSKLGLFSVDDHPLRRALVMRAFKPIERLVPVSYTHCCASTPGLSTWWSTTVLKEDLVLRQVSRLDAFSGYLFHT